MERATAPLGGGTRQISSKTALLEDSSLGRQFSSQVRNAAPGWAFVIQEVPTLTTDLRERPAAGTRYYVHYLERSDGEPHYSRATARDFASAEEANAYATTLATESKPLVTTSPQPPEMDQDQHDQS
jgi:hypothetical protein